MVHFRLANFSDVKFSQLTSGKTGTSGLGSYVKSLFDASLDWGDLRWLVNFTQLPVIVKGIMRPDDALKAIESGVSAVIVSNHGGRQLDHVPATVRYFILAFLMLKA